MADAIVRFEREDREGAAPVGSYLYDVMKRFGIPVSDDCSLNDFQHTCTVSIRSGAANLSSPTPAESEHLKAAGRSDDERLACEARIISVGEVVIMTEETKAEPKAEDAKSKIVDEFQALPLEQKLAELFRMEAVALGETLSFVVNSPYLVIEKIGDVLAEFGMKMDRESKRPRGDKKANGSGNESSSVPPPADVQPVPEPATPETGQQPG